MRHLRIRVRLLVLAVTMAAVLSSCGGKPEHFNLNNVTGTMPDLKLFGAKDTEGRVRRAADYAGRIVVLYFGYTHCPDVCPATLVKLHNALKALGETRARDVQVLFVSVDPTRDGLTVLGRYVHAFDPRFDALRLTGAALGSIASRYNVAYFYGPADASGDYSVSHSAGIYIFNRSGKMRLIGDSSDSVKAVSEDLKTLISSRKSWW